MCIHQNTVNPASFCSAHEHSCDDTMRNIDRDMERAATEAQATYYQCAAPGCTNGLRSDSQFYPACSQPCATMHGRTKSATSLRSALSIMGDVHMQQSIVDASWTTYKTGGRHWVRFRLGVQRRHPNQVVQGRFCRRTRLPVLEDDAEQQLIDFAEWLGLSGTAAPDTIEGYISAVKALHMIWCRSWWLWAPCCRGVRRGGGRRWVQS